MTDEKLLDAEQQANRGLSALLTGFVRRHLRRHLRRLPPRIDQIRVFKDNDHWAYCFSFGDGHSQTTPWDWPVEHVELGIRGAVCEIASQYGIDIDVDDVDVGPQRDAVWTRPDAE